MRRLLLFHMLLFVSYCTFSQSVGIGTTTPDNSAALDIFSHDRGLLIPRMRTTDILAIANPARGLLVYDSLTNRVMVNIGATNAPNWQPVAATAITNGWSLTGNAAVNAANQFIGTIDNQPLRFRINNIPSGELNPVNGNISWGAGAGTGNTTGFSNIAIGTDALKRNVRGTNLVAIGDSALFHNDEVNRTVFDGTGNTAIGSKSLFSNTVGNLNTATGIQSLFSNIEGTLNVATGAFALFSNTRGHFNTATGYKALFANTIGNLNTAIGSESLISNTTGFANTAAGALSLSSNTTGIDNTAIGYAALNFTVSGDSNTAIGRSALIFNTTGNANTATGTGALFNITTGSNNTGLGVNTLVSTTAASGNTAVGANAAWNFNLGAGNTIIGAGADAWGNGAVNCVAIGQNARCTGNNQVRLGNALTTSIGGVVGFSNLSDGRFKKNIHEDVKGIDFIMKLRPVTYQLDYAGINKKLNAGIIQAAAVEKDQTILSGFIAQEVEKAAQETGYDFSGVEKPKNENELYSLRYSEFVVPLVKAVQEQQQQIADLKKQNEDLLKRILALEKK